jgi:hypothetical protein
MNIGDMPTGGGAFWGDVCRPGILSLWLNQGDLMSKIANAVGNAICDIASVFQLLWHSWDRAGR